MALYSDDHCRWDELTAIIHPFYHQPWTPPSEPNFNSMGVANNYVSSSYGDVVVRDISLAVHMLSQQLYVHSWTWNGELRFSACYNEAYYEADYVEGWLAAVRDNLIENLGVGKTQN